MAVRVPAEDQLVSAMAEIKARIDRVERRIFSSTAITTHNSLGGLQGGRATERYHLDAGAYSEWANTPAAFTLDAVQAAIDAAPDYATIFLPEGTYIGTTAAGSYALSLTKPLRIIGGGRGAILQQATANAGMLSMNTSDVEIANVEFYGPQHALYIGHPAEFGIRLTGNDQTTRVSNINIHHCKFYNWGHTACWLQYVDDFKFEDNEVYDVCRSGFTTISCSFGTIAGNHIHDMFFAPSITNNYGMILSRDSTKSITDSPRSSNIVVDSNIVEDLDHWEGIDTHAGEHLVVSNNIVRHCMVGIAVLGCPNELGVDTWGCHYVTVTGNVVDSQVTDGSMQVGIKLVGPTPSPLDGSSLEYAVGTITGNIVIGHGTQSNTDSAAIQIYGTKGAVISSNTIINPSPMGIHLHHTNIGATLTGNTILDNWSTDYAFPAGIYVGSPGYNECYIGNNVIDKTGDFPGKTYYLVNGVRVGNHAENRVSWGQNRITGYTGSEVSLAGSLPSSTHSFTGMSLVANTNNVMFGLGRASGSVGLPACTNATTGAVSFRTLTAGAGISITNGDGVSGNPTISATSAGGSWTAFTPGWYGVTINPAIGNGSWAGSSYKALDASTMLINVFLTMGSTTTYGSGNWYFTLPGYTIQNQNTLGSGLVLDSSAGTTYQCVPALNASNHIYVYTGLSGAQTIASATVPFTWATSDTLRFSIIVRV